MCQEVLKFRQTGRKTVGHMVNPCHTVGRLSPRSSAQGHGWLAHLAWCLFCLELLKTSVYSEFWSLLDEMLTVE